MNVLQALIGCIGFAMANFSPAGFKRVLLILLLLLSVNVPAFGESEGEEVRIPFLFTQDQELHQSDFQKIQPKSDVLETDEYLNKPLTRLEYLLIKLEETIKEGENSALAEVAKNFDQSPFLFSTEASIGSSVRYSRDHGKIFVSYQFSDLGRPMKPMSSTCADALEKLSFHAPQMVLGYWYHNKLLGVLQQGDPEDYSKMLEVIAQNIVLVANLESVTEDKHVIQHHYLSCLRVSDGGEIQYSRSSFKNLR